MPRRQPLQRPLIGCWNTRSLRSQSERVNSVSTCWGAERRGRQTDEPITAVAPPPRLYKERRGAGLLYERPSLTRAAAILSRRGAGGVRPSPDRSGPARRSAPGWAGQHIQCKARFLRPRPFACANPVIGAPQPVVNPTNEESAFRPLPEGPAAGLGMRDRASCSGEDPGLHSR